jgi:hypothetical protein
VRPGPVPYFSPVAAAAAAAASYRGSTWGQPACREVAEASAQNADAADDAAEAGASAAFASAAGSAAVAGAAGPQVAERLPASVAPGRPADWGSLGVAAAPGPQRACCPADVEEAGEVAAAVRSLPGTAAAPAVGAFVVTLTESAEVLRP